MADVGATEKARPIVKVEARLSPAGVIAGLQHPDGSFEPHPGYEKRMDARESECWWNEKWNGGRNRVIQGVQHPDGSFEPHQVFQGISAAWWNRSCKPIPTEKLTPDGKRVIPGVHHMTGVFEPHLAFVRDLAAVGLTKS